MQYNQIKFNTNVKKKNQQLVNYINKINNVLTKKNPNIKSKI